MTQAVGTMWRKRPETHDYPAASSYLSLIFSPEQVHKLVKALKAAPMTSFKAKDIFRASRLSLLGVSNAHIVKNTRKIKEGIKLSPLLLVRDTKRRNLIIADGYHRMCSVYRIDEDADVPCKIV